MFSLFERYLQPTAVPDHPEPPDGLVAFLWHFARQAKWLFVALFVVEFFVALTDSAVPWFMGRIVTLVTSIPAERFLAETWPWLAGMALTVVVARPAIGLARYLITNQAIAAPFTGMIRWQSHWHVVRQSWAFFQNDFAGRISNRVMQTGPAVRQTLVSSVTAVWYVLVYGTTAIVMTAATDAWLTLPILGAFAADGPHRRQLHQHPHREAVRAATRRGRVRARRGRPPHRHVSHRAAAPDDIRHAAAPAQCNAHRRCRRHRHLALAARRGRG